MSTVLVRPGSAKVGSVYPLDDGETHHLRVRRVKPDDAVAVRDGAGLVAGGRLRRDGDAWVVEIETVATAAPPATLVVAAGAGDRDRFGWLVEKASELGVTTVVPLETEHTAGVATKLRGSHLDKLRRQAREVIKQSGAAWAAAVAEPMELERFLATGATGIRWLADAAGDAPPSALGRDPVTVIVGPEGGLSPAERSAVLAAGFRAIRLSAYTLRFETAAIAAAVAVNAARFRGTDG